MRRDRAIEILSAHATELTALGVKSLALFGSVARDEAREDSDVDLLIEFEPGKLPKGLAFFGFYEQLEDWLDATLWTWQTPIACTRAWKAASSPKQFPFCPRMKIK